jgi:hypothetical protein
LRVLDWDGSVLILAAVKPKSLWVGKQILSSAILRGVNIRRSPDPRSIFDDATLVENVELVFGLVHVVFREKVPEGSRHDRFSLTFK